MYRFWDVIIQPLLQVVRPSLIVEIGSDRGGNTRNLLDWCASNNAVLHVIDPLPKYDAEVWQSEYGPRLVFHKGLSLECLGEIDAAQVVLIDGDHNWFTVYNELQMIERRMKALKVPMPCILLHDVGWPYGRRDLYYDPEAIPEKDRKPYARKGLRLGESGLVDSGGMNPHLDHALHEGDPASGVLTAVEDYLKKTRQSWRWLQLEGIHGLGMLIPEKLIATIPGLEDFTAQWTLPEPVVAFQQVIEQDRLRIETERQIQRRTVLDQRRELRDKDKEIQSHCEALATLDKRYEEAARTLQEREEALKRSEAALRDRHEKAESLRQALAQAREQVQTTERGLKASAEELTETRAQLKDLQLTAERDRQVRHELEKTEATLSERVKHLNERLKESRVSVKTLKTDWKAAQEKIIEGVREQYRLQNESRDLQMALEESNRQRIKLDQRISELTGEQQQARLRIEEADRRLAEASRQQEIARWQLQEKSQEASRLAHRLKAAESEAARQKEDSDAQTARMQKEIDEQAAGLEMARQNDNERQTMLDRLRVEKIQLGNDLKALHRQLEAREQALTGELAIARREQAELKEQLTNEERTHADTELRLSEAVNDNERWKHALRSQREEATAERLRHEEVMQSVGDRMAAEAQKTERLQEELRMLRERLNELERRRRQTEKATHEQRLDFRRFYFGQQQALNNKVYVTVDYLSRSRLLRRVGALGLSLAKRLSPGLSEALDVAKQERERFARQKTRERRRGYQRRIEQYLGVSTDKKGLRKKPKISVIAWDVGHNPMGRAYLLADMFCNRSYDAELIGPQFPRYGKEVWPPLKNMHIPLQRFPGRMFPEHWADLERMASAVDGDVIYVAKPRIPSLMLGILAKMQRNRPLVLDVDDYELAFFKQRAPLTLKEIKAASRDKDFLCPHDNLWTRYAETLIPLADHITVSNAELQRKFGGTILPHVRNGQHFNPELYDRDAIRASLGFSPEDRVILFIGTPRMHKGFFEIIEALEALGNPRYKLCIIGSVVDPEVRRRLDKVDKSCVHCFPDAPFEELPRNLCAGDLICILQDPERAVSAYQMPAKVTDALSMGIPLLATDVPPLRNLADQGLLELVGRRNLGEAIDTIFRQYGKYKVRADENRKIFGRDYAYVANREKLWAVFSQLLENTPPVPVEFGRLVDFMRTEFGSDQPGAVSKVAVSKLESQTVPQVKQPASPVKPEAQSESKAPVASRQKPQRQKPPVDDKINVVFFWKQNDSDIYGRRQDMMVKYLAAHPRINQIIHFDAPIEYDTWMGLRNWSRERHYDQRALIFNLTLRRVLGLGNQGKVIRRTYVYRCRKDVKDRGLRRWFGREDGYLDFVRRILDRQRVWDRRTVFWVCPANFQFPGLMESFAPDLVLADVIDDQRKWNCREKYRQRLQENYERILTGSDLVITNCDNVARSMGEFRQSIEIIPNACEYLNGRLPSLSRPWAYRKMRGPIIGYVGNLDVSRLDMELLEYLARKRPEWNFVLIGSLHMNRDILELRRHGNVHFMGVIPYDKALAYIRHFDVAIIPHIDNGMTQMMNPLKTYVYCSLDVPVVSTAIRNLDAMASIVHVAHSRSLFLKKIELCLKNGKPKSRAPEIDQLLQSNSWQSRVDDVMNHILAHPAMTETGK